FDFERRADDDRRSVRRDHEQDEPFAAPGVVTREILKIRTRFDHEEIELASLELVLGSLDTLRENRWTQGGTLRAARCVRRGLDGVTWPHDVRTVASLGPPKPSKEGQVTFPGRRSQPGIAAVELDTALTVDKNQTESVFHIRVGRQRPATVVRVADHMLVEIDKQSRLAGLWLLEVPPFPNVEATAEWTRDSSATSPSCSPLKIRFSPKSAPVTPPRICRRSTSRLKKSSCSTSCCTRFRRSACWRSVHSAAIAVCGWRAHCLQAVS